MVIFLKNACYDVLKKQKKLQILEVYGVFNIIPVLDQTAGVGGVELPEPSPLSTSYPHGLSRNPFQMQHVQD